MISKSPFSNHQNAISHQRQNRAFAKLSLSRIKTVGLLGGTILLGVCLYKTTQLFGPSSSSSTGSIRTTELNSSNQQDSLVEGTFALRRHLEGHEGGVLQAFFVRDNSKIATYGLDGTFRIWDSSNGQQIKKIENKFSEVKTFDHSKDGTKILSPTDGGALLLWELETEKTLRDLTGLETSAETTALSPAGNFAAASSDKDVLIWDVSKSVPIHILKSHTAPVCAICFSPDETQLLSADQNGDILLWNLKSGTREKKLDAQLGTGQPSWLDFSTDSKHAYSAGTSSNNQNYTASSVKVWDLNSGKLEREIPTDFNNSQHMRKQIAISPNGRFLAAPQTFDGTRAAQYGISVWDLESGKPLGDPIPSHGQYVTSLAFSAKSNGLVSSSIDSFAIYYEMAPNSSTNTNKNPSNEQTSNSNVPGIQLEPQNELPLGRSFCVKFNTEGSRLLSGDFDDSVSVYDLKSGAVLSSWNETRAKFSFASFSRLGFLADEQKVYVSAWNEVNVREASTGKIVTTFTGHRSQVLCVTPVVPGNDLISASGDGQYIKWNGVTGREEKSFTIPGEELPSQIQGIAPGKLLVLSKHLFLYDLENDKIIRVYANSRGVKNFVALKDGQRLIGRAPSGIVSWKTDSARPLGVDQSQGSADILASNANPYSETFGQISVYEDGTDWMDCDPNGVFLGSVKGGKGKISMLSHAKGSSESAITIPNGMVERLWFVPDSHKILIAGQISGKPFMKTWKIIN